MLLGRKVTRASDSQLLECDICSHARLDDSFPVVDSNFHGKDLMVPFVAALYIAGSELALRVNLLDDAVKTPTGIRVHIHFRFLTNADSAELRLRDVDSHP